jgi:lipopolysaccharide transport system ATP-binding protein
VKGRIAALLELGSGFNPEFTGRENVYLNASILGLSKKDIDARYDEIAAFADIGDFIDQPVKTYSSGMMVRLAFAVQVMVDPDILIVDEALAVGDAFFQQKCMSFLKEFCKGHTVLFVSHDTGAVTALCNRAILLANGSIEMEGPPTEVAKQYLLDYYQNVQDVNGAQNSGESETAAVESFVDMRQELFNQTELRTDIELFKFDPGASSFGDGGATLSRIRMLDSKRNPLAWAVGGEVVILEIAFKVKRDITSPIVGFTIKNRYGQNVVVDNTYITYRGNPLSVSAGQTVVAEFEFVMPIIAVGEYSISPAIADGTQENHVQLCWVNDAMIFAVHSTSCMGMMGFPMKRIEMKTA